MSFLFLICLSFVDIVIIGFNHHLQCWCHDLSNPYSSKTRQKCVESSQKVFDRLMLSTEDGTATLPFSVFTVLATDDSGD